MTTCESCGQKVSDSASRCPSCGALLVSSSSPHSTSFEQPDHLPGFEAYIPEPHLVSDRPYRIPLPQPALEEEKDQQEQPEEHARSTPLSETTFHIFNSPVAAPLLIETLLSLFLGIFGVGWLLAGEIPIGILLLAGSFLLYLPLVIVSFILAIASVGLSLLCTGPLAIGAVCLNAFLLQNRLKRKRAADAQRNQHGSL